MSTMTLSTAQGLLLAGSTVAIFAYLYAFRLFDISISSPYAWAAIVVLDDFAHCWCHRIRHQCRPWWAAHVNHHSSQEYSFSAANVRAAWLRR
jgi:sterol desaturase/sphingolipid hydroxylase (fatty acid hydroxylase superfamily)